jgi:hypothetical protein
VLPRANAALSELVQPGYVVHHITAFMLSVRLCGEGASGLVFFLLGVI